MLTRMFVSLQVGHPPPRQDAAGPIESTVIIFHNLRSYVINMHAFGHPWGWRRGKTTRIMIINSIRAVCRWHAIVLSSMQIPLLN